MKNKILLKNLNVGARVTECDVPYKEFQITAVGNDQSITLIDVNSKRVFSVSTADFLSRYRFFYHSPFTVE
jgi:hypothetical protein